MNIEISIDQLVLHGFEPGQRMEIAAALEQSLQQAFAAQGIEQWQSAEVYMANAGHITLPAGARSHVIGNSIGQSVAAAIQGIGAA